MTGIRRKSSKKHNRWCIGGGTNLNRLHVFISVISEENTSDFHFMFYLVHKTRLQFKFNVFFFIEKGSTENTKKMHLTVLNIFGIEVVRQTIAVQSFRLWTKLATQHLCFVGVCKKWFRVSIHSVGSCKKHWGLTIARIAGHRCDPSPLDFLIEEWKWAHAQHGGSVAICLWIIDRLL